MSSSYNTMSSSYSTMASANNTHQGSGSAAGTGITGGYTGNSLTLHIFIALLLGLSLYNAVELNVMIFVTFTRYKGLYFWSLIVASCGIIPYAIGFILKFYEITRGRDRWVSIVLLTIGWYSMVTGQSVVLWSRLHLIVRGNRGRRFLRWTMIMIIVDAIIFHIPTTVLTFGSNGAINVPQFVRAFNIYEKAQMVGFLYVHPPPQTLISPMLTLFPVASKKSSCPQSTSSKPSAYSAPRSSHTPAICCTSSS